MPILAEISRAKFENISFQISRIGQTKRNSIKPYRSYSIRCVEVSRKVTPPGSNVKAETSVHQENRKHEEEQIQRRADHRVPEAGKAGVCRTRSCAAKAALATTFYEWRARFGGQRVQRDDERPDHRADAVATRFVDRRIYDLLRPSFWGSTISGSIASVLRPSSPCADGARPSVRGTSGSR